ncbi:protein YIF1B-B isoform X1 [Bactrocera neohumeralis]|uniref:protein YIF1B-B isoform X1 n=1 Tax=Bactrocera neohumeralis TaxID=98809 RepID=UPI00216538E2|nr:protein YIF1B-B isoform X1 [Bactrocera neohumeralis]
MNYNPNAGIRNRKLETSQGPSRKPKRVSDINAMGPTAPMNAPLPYMQPTVGAPLPDHTTGVSVGYGMAPQQTATNIGGFNTGPAPVQNQNYSYTAPPTSQPTTFAAAPAAQPQYGGNMPMGGPGGMGAAPGAQGQFQAGVPQFAMFQQPIVQDMAMQYGQRLADQGKQLVENQFEKWVSVAKLKYYFAVDNKYVINKLRLLLFPFTHKDWSLKYDQENPVQPRYDINAPDLYIPAMAYITYVVVAGLMLGLQNRFSPEQLGIQASSALAYCIFELVVYSITLYVVNIKTSLKTLDLLSFAGYKFVIIVTSLLVSTLFHGVGYYVALLYTSLTLGFFLLRTLKTKVLHDATPTVNSGAINYDPYGNPQQLDYTGGRKRKLYFLFLIVGGQALLSFLLSKHLYFPDAAVLAVRNEQF